MFDAMCVSVVYVYSAHESTHVPKYVYPISKTSSSAYGPLINPPPSLRK